eukprot:TRINITY_DN10_c0_g1_i2.p1 TRINITY_DN10_c0_g1~~TRINITY_DN10_c0_g1_i2.p1  ORF type:complete len:749 (+),score=108.26 TRINITY_DN10_c0_g1_i2:2522-4768(+)
MRRNTCLKIGFLVLCLFVVGCGRSKPKPAAEAENAPADQLRTAANERLKSAVQLATVHLRYKEYDQAEKCLQDAISDDAGTEKAAAFALLDIVKATKRAEMIAKEATNVVPPGLPPGINLPVTPPQPVSVPPTHPNSSNEPKVDRTVQASIVPQLEVQQPKVEVFESDPATTLPGSKTAVTDDEVTDLENKARAMYEAKESLKLYERFLALHTLKESQQKKVNTALEKWKGHAEKGLVRNGTVWVTVEAAKKNADEAESLIAEASALIAKGNFKEAGEALVKASRLDQNGIRADFILGMLNSGVGFNNLALAEDNFRKVLIRSPRHISALNNLALVEIKQGKMAPAVAHLAQATERAPRLIEINQNLGRVIKEAKEKKLVVPPAVLAKFTKLYDEESASGKADPSAADVGWLYMPLYLPEKEKTGETDPKSTGELILTSSGTGFVIAPGFLLTNRHVVKDDDFGLVDAVRIIDPSDANHQRELAATVVAVSADLDLAILKCVSLKSAPVTLSPATPRRGTDVLALGYPKTDLIGRGLKATRGIVTGLPEAANDYMLMFDVEVNPGNSGGPILDRTGAAVAIATIKYNSTFVGNYSSGILAAKALPFAAKIIPGFEPALPAQSSEKSWPDIDAEVAPSTVMIHAYYRTMSISIGKGGQESKTKGSGSIWEDASCSRCSGSGGVRCTNSRCVAGVIQTREEYTVMVGEGALRTSVQRFNLVKSACPICSGKGRVDCKACVNGIDPSVRAR